MNPKGTFAIKTKIFEGPMELLIELVEKRKLLINDISLAAVTDEYMQAVSLMQELSLPNTAQFVNLAATLLLIKSKSLLPVLDLTEEETASIEDLEDRLKHYQVYRDASLALQARFGKHVMYEAEYTPPRDSIFMPDNFCTLGALSEALQQVITNLPKEQAPKPTAKVRQIVSLEDMMKRLQSRIEQEMKIKFSRLRATEKEHKNVIVGFLAILELFKQGSVLVSQTGRFADIEIEMSQASTPRYY